MDRRVFLGTLGGGLLAAPLAAEGQQAPTIRRIGWVTTAAGTDPEFADARKEGLRRLGWIEGQNIVVEVLFGDTSLRAAVVPAQYVCY
jgi:putative ABC transport system substrate-binding protein